MAAACPADSEDNQADSDSPFADSAAFAGLDKRQAEFADRAVSYRPAQAVLEVLVAENNRRVVD